MSDLEWIDKLSVDEFNGIFDRLSPTLSIDLAQTLDVPDVGMVTPEETTTITDTDRSMLCYETLALDS